VSAPTDRYGCELSTARIDREGYAFEGRSRAHVVAWTKAHGAVPDGMELDHLCRRRHCRALHHLELVTRSENEKRKSWKYRARRTHCPKGHELAINGVVTPEGGKVCRACNREAQGART
jgi:hypothetical protein